MIRIAFMQDSNLLVGSFHEDHLLSDVVYVVIDREIAEPIESWYIEDGQVKIDQKKLIEFNRKNMLNLQPMDFDLKLNKYGLYDAVQDLIATDRELFIAYNRAAYFSRTDPFIEQTRIALNLSHEQIDEMWMN